MASITTSFLKQGTCGSTGNVRTCFRDGNSGASSTCDIGGTGSGTSYNNTVAVRFDTVPTTNLATASVTITYQQSGSSATGWAATQTISVQGCANFTNSTTGAALPAKYGSAKTGTIAGSTASVTIECLAQLNAAISKNSKCLYISANKADNRKRVSAITLNYTTASGGGSIVFNGSNVTTVVYNGTTLTHLIYNGTTIF